MKVVICVSKTAHPEAVLLQQPVGALYAGTVLKRMGHEVMIVDLRLTQVPTDILEPDIIFLLTETYDRSQCFSLDLKGAQRAVKTLRNVWPRTPIVSVGVHATLLPGATLRTLDTDMALGGEIEVSIPSLLDQCSQIPSCLDNLPLTAHYPQLANLCTLPVPDYSLVDSASYKGEVVRASPRQIDVANSGLIFANRGCPYGCGYCFSWGGGKQRRRPVDLVVKELKRQESLGIKNFFFLDYTFTLDWEWVEGLCDQICQAQLEVNWVCQSRCDRVSPDLLVKMQSAGCKGVWYGVESLWISDVGLGKPIDPLDIEKAIDWTFNSDLQCFLFIMLGLGKEHFHRERELVKWLAQVPAFFLAQPLVPRPGTGLWRKHLRANNLKFNNWQEVHSTSLSLAKEYYWHPQMEEIQEFLANLPNNVDNL